MISKTAKDLYFHVHDISGWLPMLERFTGDNGDDLHNFADYTEELERDYKNNQKQLEDDLFEWCKTIVKEEPALIPKPKTTEGEVTQHMIERAREFPIDQLIENKRFWAKCPFHADTKPSLYLKNNFYHCFVCEANGDTIKLAQHIYNVDFKTAVKMLQ